MRKRFVLLIFLVLAANMVCGFGRRPDDNAPAVDPSELENAQNQLRDYGQNQGWTEERRKRAASVLNELARKGVPPSYALERIQNTPERELNRLTEQERIREMKNDYSLRRIRSAAGEQNMERARIDAAENAYKELTGKGVSPETAREQVMAGIRNNYSVSQFRRLSSRERIRELIKREELERMRERERQERREDERERQDNGGRRR